MLRSQCVTSERCDSLHQTHQTLREDLQAFGERVLVLGVNLIFELVLLFGELLLVLGHRLMGRTVDFHLEVTH